MASLKSQGFAQAVRKLRSIGPRVRGRLLRDAVRASARVLQREVQADEPVATGYLREHVHVRDIPRRGRSVQAEVEVSKIEFGGESWYGAAEEYGTKYQAGAHAMSRADAAVGQKAARVGARVLLDGIQRELNK